MGCGVAGVIAAFFDADVPSACNACFINLFRKQVYVWAQGQLPLALWSMKRRTRFHTMNRKISFALGCAATPLLIEKWNIAHTKTRFTEFNVSLVGKESFI